MTKEIGKIKNMRQLVIFTDLDGTLLDSFTYSFEKALPASELVRQKDIPLVICSSKTKKEIEFYRKKLKNDHPFVSENGGGIFVPKNYFEFMPEEVTLKLESTKDYIVIRLGAVYSDLRRIIGELQKEGFDVKGFGDLTIKEVAEVAGLSIEEAEMAKKRDFDEPFIFAGNGSEIQKVFEAIKGKGFNYTQGRFFHLLGNSDKGRAISILIKLYKRKFGKVLTAALGDSPNDLSMLQRVDYPVVVQKPGGIYDPQIHLPNLIKADGIGPEGWKRAVLKLIGLYHTLNP